MVVSRSSSARRSISSEIAFTCMSRLAPAICLRRDWAMTSSPTWSIRSSRRSAGTRMLPAERAELRLGTDGRPRAAGNSGGPRFGCVARHLLEVELHLVEHEQEHLLDRRARLPGGQRHVPADMASGRIERLERRDRAGVGDDGARAERAQLVEQQQRIGAHRHGVGRQTEPEPPGDGGIGGRAVGRRRERRLQASRMAAPSASLCAVGLLDQPADLVLRRQRDRDQRRARGDLALAHTIECGFDVMGEGGDGVEAEHRAGALDRVQGAERGVDQVGIARRVLEIEQRLLELFQQFGRLLAVDLGGIGAAHAPSTLRTTASN